MGSQQHDDACWIACPHEGAPAAKDAALRADDRALWLDEAEQTLDGTLPYGETWRVNAEAVVALVASLTRAEQQRDKDMNEAVDEIRKQFLRATAAEGALRDSAGTFDALSRALLTIDVTSLALVCEIAADDARAALAGSPDTPGPAAATEAPEADRPEELAESAPDGGQDS